MKFLLWKTLVRLMRSRRLFIVVALTSLVNGGLTVAKDNIGLNPQKISLELRHLLSSKPLDVLAIKRLALDAGFSFKQSHAILKPGMINLTNGFGYFQKTNEFYDGRGQGADLISYGSPSFPSGYAGGVSIYKLDEGVQSLDGVGLEGGPWMSDSVGVFVISPYGFVLVDLILNRITLFTSDYWNSGHENKILPWLKSN